MKKTFDISGITKPSGLVIVFCFCFCSFTMDLWRTWHYDKTNFYWDVANYYSYLPAAFCNNGSFNFKNPSEDYLTISTTGKRMPKVTYGMAVFYSPAFALGYKIAFNSNESLDGFSEPFAICLHWISILYGFIGLILLRNFLLKFFSEVVTALTLMIVFAGTMLFYYTMGNNEMTHTYLFFLISAFLLVTYHWHEKVTYKKTILIGLIIGFISLIRPSEILVFLIFVFWNVKSRKDIKTEAAFFLKNWVHLLIIFIIGVLIWIPQFIYWKELTGAYVYSPYAANGERFFWGDPQIFNILFSYRKGWFVYTPLITLAFVGFFFMKGEVKKLRGVLIALVCINVYLLSCWWDWFFGGCFGARGFSQHIAFMAIPIASLTDYIVNKENKGVVFQLIKVAFFVFVFSGISLNVGQTYQYTRNYIHSTGMSKKVYWKIFGEYDIDGDHYWRYWQSLNVPDYDKLKSGEDRNQ